MTMTTKRKSFKTYTPTEDHEIEVGDQVFQLNPSIPGDVMLDFIANASSEDPATLAKTVRGMLDAAIREDQLDAWHEFIRDPRNNVSLEVLSEIAGHVSEVMSGNPRKGQPAYGPG